MTAAPAGQSKAAEENKPTASGSPAEGEALPTPASPTDPVPSGEVEVTRKATKDETGDPGGKITVRTKVTRASKGKKDALKEISDLEKLPVAVAVGQITASVQSYNGRPVLELSLVGWVGDAPLKILAEDVGDLEDALASLRAQLG